MLTFSEMLALVQSESSFGAFVFHRRPAGLQATSDLVRQGREIHCRLLQGAVFHPGLSAEDEYCKPSSDRWNG